MFVRNQEWRYPLFCYFYQGLDVTHVGIAYWKDGQLTFIHASSSAKKMIPQAHSLRDSAEGIKSCKGILVARPLSIY